MNTPKGNHMPEKYPEDRDEVLRRASVMMAYADGKKLEREWRPAIGQWTPETGQPTWDWTQYDWRVVPEPLRQWVNVYRDGTVDTYDSEEAAKKWAVHEAIRIAVPMIEVQE